MEKNDNEIRLQKFLANSGVASRRKSEELILEGRVKVNGKVVTELGTKVNPEDEVICDGKQVELNKEGYIYILLNKPIGYVTSSHDQFGRDDILDLVKVKERVVSVGRLDMYTSGAIILTNDGDFVYKVTHPKHEIVKTYQVTVKGKVTDEDIDSLKNGVIIDDNYLTKEADARIMKIDEEKNISRIEIKIHEGRNRQVRKMCEAIGKKVIALHRSKIGSVGVKDLPIGKWRYLKEYEVKNILEGK